MTGRSLVEILESDEDGWIDPQRTACWSARSATISGARTTEAIR